VFITACHWYLCWIRCISPHLLPYLPKIHSNIIFPAMLRSSKWSLPFRFSNQNLLCIHISTMHVHACPSLPSWHDHHYNIWWSVQVMKLLIMQPLPASCHFPLLKSKYSPQHLVWEIKFHTHTKQEVQLWFFYILIFKNFERRREDKTLNTTAADIPRI